MKVTLPPKLSKRKANQTLKIEILGNLNHDAINEPELSVTQSTHQWLANNLAHLNRLSSHKMRMQVFVYWFLIINRIGQFLNSIFKPKTLRSTIQIKL